MSSTASTPGHLTAALSEWMQELAPFGVLTTDLDLNVQGWNQWLAIHSSLPASKVIGRPLGEVVPEIITRKLDHYFRRALAGEVSLLSSGLHGHLIPLPMTMIRDDQQPHMLQTARIAPLISNGKVLGTITVVEDVSQRDHHAAILRRQHGRERLLSWALAHLLQSEDPLKDLEAIFPKIANDLSLQIHFHYLLSPDKQTLRLHSAAGISEEQKITYGSFDVGEHACGRCVSLGQAIYLPQLQTKAPPYASVIQQLGLRCYAGFPLKIRDQVLGVLSFGSLSRETITPEEIELLTTIAQYVAIALDRSSREKILTATQKSLLDHTETLESKVAERTARLYETIVHLESFSYTVAHDLRTPIRALKGYCSALHEDYAEMLPPEAQRVLGRLSHASQQLDALTRDLLTFTKLSRQTIQLNTVDLDEVIDDILLLTPALAPEVLSVDHPLGKAWGQRTLLQQCLSNLFDNALKFRRPGVPPRIRVWTERTEHPYRPLRGPATATFNPATHPQGLQSDIASDASGHASWLRIWVEDNGVGIPTEYQEKIFGIFERIEGTNTPEGTGIGLAIVARAMQQIGGSCGVESNGTQGSRFWLDCKPAP